ncbi:MAG: outer membrane protein assembly factor [Bacteroidales bacterium]|nr:outer membrane protein assembly factor [Bacteroidales bacterium]
MKKTFFFLLMMTSALSISAQDNKVKTGWKFGGALPAISFDSDLGFQYGALVEFFNYGDGSTYPDYFDHTYTEVSHYTKGSGIFRFMYESNHLIKGVHMTTDLSYLPDQASHFYGFNGYESVFHKDWMDDELSGAGYRTRMFYRFQRNQFRFKNDFQGKLSGEHLKWSAGFAFQNFKINSVDIDKLNKGKNVKLPAVADQPGLFELYNEMGLIPNDEISGGWVNTIKAGLVYDSRDNRPNPMKGIWTEIGVEAAPSFMGNDNNFSKLYITHRQYFTLIEKDLSLVYRLGYQSTISGNVPFYYQSQVITSMLTGATSEGLGGASTLRGVLKNRVLGDAFFFGNIELRWKPLYFTFLKQDCYLGLDGFYDFGQVTKNIELPDNLIDAFYNSDAIKNIYKEDSPADYFKPGTEKLHQSAGVSLMAAMNQNFVIAVDMGKAFNKQDGNIGFAIGLNYLF